MSECGKEFYWEFTDYDKVQVDDWIEDNVINNLLFNSRDEFSITEGDKATGKGDKCLFKLSFKWWIKDIDNVEIYSDCLHYDWVLFLDIFGTAFDLPKNIYYIPFDLCSFLKTRGIDPDISREEFIGNSVEGKKHNALYDAKVIKACFENLHSDNSNNHIKESWDKCTPREIDKSPIDFNDLYQNHIKISSEGCVSPEIEEE